jgi:hypothetical protein
MNKIFVVVLLSLYWSSSWADISWSPSSQGPGETYHLNFEGNIGYPTVKIANPDGTDAIYRGVALRGNVLIPLLDFQTFTVYLSPGIKYLDLANRANSGSQKEVANLIGPGAGLSFKLGQFWLGAKYYQMWARHYSTGTFSNNISYNFRAVDYYAGYQMDFTRFGIGAMYSFSTQNISRDQTGLSTDSPYRESIFWFQLTISTGETLWQTITSFF